MKLCFTLKRLEGMAGGAERVFTTIVNGLASAGHQITVISFDRPEAQPFYALSPAVTWTRIQLGDSSKPATLSDLIKRMLTLRKTLKNMPPDVAIGFMHSSFIPTSLAVAGLGIPVIGSEHIVADHYRNRPADYVLYALSSIFLKHITVLSENVKAAFPWILRRKMTAISNPVEATTIGDPSKQRDVILAIGRLDPQKDHSTLIAAFARIAQSHPSWTLKIIGDGPLRAQLQSQIDSLQLASRITLLPATRDIGSVYEEASLFVVPSLYESFGMVTVEAMMAGLPCIGFATCPGTNEIITDQVTGLLVQPVPDRVTALANAMAHLITSSTQRGQLGQTAQQDARKYAVAPILQQWQTLLQETARP